MNTRAKSNRKQPPIEDTQDVDGDVDYPMSQSEIDKRRRTAERQAELSEIEELSDDDSDSIRKLPSRQLRRPIVVTDDEDLPNIESLLNQESRDVRMLDLAIEEDIHDLAQVDPKDLEDGYNPEFLSQEPPSIRITETRANVVPPVKRIIDRTIVDHTQWYDKQRLAPEPRVKDAFTSRSSVMERRDSEPERQREEQRVGPSVPQNTAAQPISQGYSLNNSG
jgi:hypothetical protein